MTRADFSALVREGHIVPNGRDMWRVSATGQALQATRDRDEITVVFVDSE